MTPALTHLYPEHQEVIAEVLSTHDPSLLKTLHARFPMRKERELVAEILSSEFLLHLRSDWKPTPRGVLIDDALRKFLLLWPITRHDPRRTYMCPACGYDGLDEPSYSRSGSGSDDICTCCGFQLGKTEDDDGFTHEQWRHRWIELGMLWRHRQPPAGWDPVAQLARITDNVRLHTLKKLLELQAPIWITTAELQAFPFDGPELVVLKRQHAIRLLQGRYAGSFSVSSCAAWATAIELRDDIAREYGHEQLLNQLLFELATPQLHGPFQTVDWLFRLS